MQSSSKRFKVATALLCIAGAANAAETSLLPIVSGTYIVANFKPCADAPNAAVIVFDGKSISGSHSSNCTSTIRGHHDKTYEVVTTCPALGDGTPAQAGPDVEYLRIESPTHFVRLGQGNYSDYELCPGWH